MINKNAYPNVKWAQFSVCNDNERSAFEDMTRRLFYYEFLKENKVPHANHANPGVEVLPILEPPRLDGSRRRYISFQAKYFEQTSVDYSQIQKSAKQAVKHYKGKLDLIYLFSNRTLTTTSRGYKETDKLLSDAGIELYPISNEEVLDLVVKYREIANYFFLPRRVANSFPDDVPFSGLAVINVAGRGTDSAGSLQHRTIDEQLLKEFVTGKIQTCKTHILALELDDLKAELDRVLYYNINGIDGAEMLFYYELLSRLHAGVDIEEVREKLSSKYYEEVEWVVQFYQSPTVISAEEFKKHMPETQIFILDKLFTSQHWQCVVDLYSAMNGIIIPDVSTQFELHYGLALFNLQKYDRASEVLHLLYDKTNESRIQLYSIFANIRKINSEYNGGGNGDKEGLITLLKQLDKFKELKQYHEQELLIAALKLESSYQLGLFDKSYL